MKKLKAQNVEAFRIESFDTTKELLDTLQKHQEHQLRQLALSPALANSARSFNLDPVTLFYSPDNRYLWGTTFTDVIKVSRDSSNLYYLSKVERPGWQEDLGNGR